MSSYNPYLTQSALHEAYLAVKRAQPDMGLADISALLRVTEEELLLESGLQVFPLSNDWAFLFGTLPALGIITFVAGNGLVRQAQTGQVRSVAVRGLRAHLTGTGLDITVDCARWRQAFYVQGCLESRHQHGIYCFDQQGHCCQQLLLRTEAPCRPKDVTDARAPKQITPSATTRLAAASRIATLNLPSLSPRERRDFIADWSVMQTEHDYRVLLQQHGLSEHQALQLVAPVYAHGVDSEAVGTVLRMAAKTGLPLTVSCNGSHLTQTYTGSISRCCQLQRSPLPEQPEAALSLRIAAGVPMEAWVVRRPGTGGIRTMLEIFDRQGRLALRLADGTHPAHAESEEWRELLEELPVIATASLAAQTITH